MDHDYDCECCSNGRDAVLVSLERMIREHGIAIVATRTITADGALDMSYTVGLADAGLPEIIAFALPQHTAAIALNNAARRLKAGTLPLDVPLAEIGNLPTVFKAVPAAIAANYIFVANDRAGKELEAIQLVWPDPEGKFPWDSGFDQRFTACQPSLYQITH